MKFTTWSFEQLSMINLSGTKKLSEMKKVGRKARETILRKVLMLVLIPSSLSSRTADS